MENKKPKLFCHYYFFKSCRNGNKCRYNHESDAITCPNGKRCYVRHSKIDCPYELNNVICEKDCSYHHAKRSQSIEKLPQEILNDEQKQFIKNTEKKEDS